MSLNVLTTMASITCRQYHTLEHRWRYRSSKSPMTAVLFGLDPKWDKAISLFSAAPLISRLSSLKIRQPLPQRHESTLRLSHLFQPTRCHSKISFRPSAALRRRFAKLGGHEAFVFQTLQCGVHAADSDVTPSALFKLL